MTRALQACQRAACAIIVLVTFSMAATGSASGAARFANFESPQTEPIALSADGQTLFAVNTDDNRLAVISTATGALVREVSVGLEPVSVAVRPGGAEVWVVNHLSDSVDVIGTVTWLVQRTIPVGDEPAGIVFTPDGAKAYVTLSQANQLAVIDAGSRSVTTRLSLDTPPSFNTQDPRALAIDPAGGRVFIAPFESGNRTRGAGPDPSQPANAQGRIVVDPALSDTDLFIVRTSDDSIVGRVDSLGTLLTNVRVSPDGKRIYVTGMDARNTVLGVDALGGHPTINQLTIVDAATLAVIRKVDLDVPPAYARSRAVSQPYDMAFDRFGRIWIAAQGNDEVVVHDVNGAQLARVSTGRGPRGLVIDNVADRLYVFDRIGHDITVVDTKGTQAVRTVPVGYDPMPARIAAGRGFFYSAAHSGDGTQACASCHADAHHDNLVWDLGDAADPKGPMFTMTIRGLSRNAPYHWRGEIKSLLDFNSAFSTLLHGTTLQSNENQEFSEFLGAVDYPPNPNLNRDGSFSSTLAVCGQELFAGADPVDCPPLPAGQHHEKMNCMACHTMPDGSNHLIIPASILDTPDDMEVTQLRGLFDKVAFKNDGRNRTLVDFLSTSPPFPKFPAADKSAMQEFLLQFPTTENHASVGIERTVGPATCAGGSVEPEIAGTIAFLEGMARNGVVDLVAAGRMNGYGRRSYFLYDPAGARYLPDASFLQPTTTSAILAAACGGGANLTFTAWPVGTGARARDRDLDGLLNGDEARYGTSPTNPDTDGDGLLDGQEVTLGTNPTKADTDGDSVSDGQEVADGTNPLDPASWLHFVAVDRVNGTQVRLTWSTEVGRTYTVSKIDGPMPHTPGAPWTDVYTSPPETQSPGGTEAYTDPDPPPPPGGIRFYSVRAN
jgi:YVTN family beta-propeller protein